MRLWGLRGYTHGGAYVLTVMGDAGATAALAAVRINDDIHVESQPGLLPRYHEKGAGGIDRLIAENGIELLELPDWRATKERLGDAVYR
jgi:hypothetical protein